MKKQAENGGAIGLSFVIPHRAGESVADTVAALRAGCSETGLRFEILTACGNNPTAQRNRCVGRAQFSYVYFLDNDSVLSSASLRCLKARLAERPEIDILGGPSLTPGSDGRLQRVFGAVLSSVFAVGPIAARYARRGRFRRADDSALILCNLLVRKRVFEALGGFDENLYPNEENEFIHRALAAGAQVFYEPGLSVYRSQRGSLRAFASQIFNYGRGRGEQTRRAPGSFNAFLLVPVLFAAYLLAFCPVLAAAAVRLGGVGWFQWVWIAGCVPLVFYVAGALLAAAPIAVSAGFGVVWVPPLFLLTHLCYAGGLLYGLLPREYEAAQRTEVGEVEEIS